MADDASSDSNDDPSGSAKAPPPSKAPQKQWKINRVDPTGQKHYDLLVSSRDLSRAEFAGFAKPDMEPTGPAFEALKQTIHHHLLVEFLSKCATNTTPKWIKKHITSLAFHNNSDNGTTGLSTDVRLIDFIIKLLHTPKDCLEDNIKVHTTGKTQILVTLNNIDIPPSTITYFWMEVQRLFGVRQQPTMAAPSSSYDFTVKRTADKAPSTRCVAYKNQRDVLKAVDDFSRRVFGDAPLRLTAPGWRALLVQESTRKPELKEIWESHFASLAKTNPSLISTKASTGEGDGSITIQVLNPHSTVPLQWLAAVEEYGFLWLSNDDSDSIPNTVTQHTSITADGDDLTSGEESAQQIIDRLHEWGGEESRGRGPGCVCAGREGNLDGHDGEAILSHILVHVVCGVW